MLLGRKTTTYKRHSCVQFNWSSYISLRDNIISMLTLTDVLLEVSVDLPTIFAIYIVYGEYVTNLRGDPDDPVTYTQRRRLERRSVISVHHPTSQ